MKKIFLLLTMISMVLSCTVENDLKNDEVNQNESDARLAYDYAEDSNLGVYKGVFTTLDSKHRGVVTLFLTNNPSQKIKYPYVSITMNNGETYMAKAKQSVDAQVFVDQLLFESKDISLSFTVNADGSDPLITNVDFKGNASDIVILKDTERAPVTPITGTYECGTCNGHPVLGTGLEQSFNFVFTTPDGNGSITTQSALGTTIYNGIGFQDNCYSNGTISLCAAESGDGSTTTTGFLANGNPVTWLATHLFDNQVTGADDCSQMSGTWQWQSISYGLINGTFTSDAICSEVLAFEDFEDNDLTYNSNPAADISDIAAKDYFGVILSDSGLPSDVIYNGIRGNGFYGAQDTDGTPSGNIDDIDLVWTDLSIAGLTTIDVSGFFGEDDSNDGDEDWDGTSSVRVEYSFDNVNWNSVIAFESELGTDGNETNEIPRLDTDGDGVGDGTALTDTMALFTANFATSGNPTVSIRVRIETMDSADEDIAIDNVLIRGN